MNPTMIPTVPKRERHNHGLRVLVACCVLALAVLALILLVPGAHAATSPASWSCAQLNIVGATGSSRYDIVLGSTAIQCNTGTPPFDHVASGASFSITCTRTDSGTVPPSAPDTNGLTFRLYYDNTGFPNGAGQFFSTTRSSCSTSGTTITPIYCTSDGTVTGSPRIGPVRLYFRALRTTIPTYDDNTDQGSQGSDSALYAPFWCDPVISAVNATSAAGDVHTFIGGDTITSKITSNGQLFTTTADTVPKIACGAVNTLSDITLSAGSAVSASTTIQGSASQWVDDCSLGYEWDSKLLTQLTGFTTQRRWTFSQSVPAGVTKSADNGAIFWNASGQVVDRTLTPTGTCSVQINGASSVGTVAMRKDAVTVTGCNPWKDARSGNVPNNQAGRGWFQKSGDYRVTTDYASLDGLFATPGSLPVTLQSTTTATTTTGQSYHKMVEEFGTTGRTDSVLWNWGNSSGQFDVKASPPITSILNSKTSGGANATSFAIGADLENVEVLGVKNYAGQAIASVNMTCQRTLPDTSTEPAESVGATDASGNTANHVFQVFAPAGTWLNTCTGSMNGNSWTYTIAFFHVSAFTADKNVVVKWNVTSLPNGTYFVNITAILVEYDPVTDQMIAIFPDVGSTPKLNVSAYDIPSGRYTDVLLAKQAMINTDGPLSTSYYWTFYTTPSKLFDIFAFVNTNVTGSPFVGSEGYSLVISSSCGSTNATACTNFYAQNASIDNLTFTNPSGMITTAFDPWIPLVIWGLLFLFLAWVKAWAPMYAAMLAIITDLPAAAGLTPPAWVATWTLPTQVLIFLILFVLHVMVTAGWLPGKWGKRQGSG